MMAAAPAPGVPPPSPSAREPVSVVIVNFNGAALLQPCLESVFAQPYRPLDVLVVDNASTDGSREMVRRLFPQVRLILNEVNMGFAGANNKGVDLAAGDRIVLLNNDTVVDYNWLTGLLEAACQAGVGVVTSRVVTEGVPEAFYEMNGTINYLGYNIMRTFHDLSTVFYAGGASLAFSKRTVGLPFLPEYFLYHEDVFLSWRMRLRGLSVRMAQQSLVRHVGSATTRRQSSSFVTFYQERNRILNALLLYERRSLVLLLPFFLGDAMAKFSMALFGQGKSFPGLVRAYAWLITHTRWIARKRKDLQQERKAGDREIMQWMSCKVMQGEGTLASVVNAISSAYARFVGLAFYD
jgi:GT2 family glycosyltransferase